MFCLDASPDVIYKRKQELSLEEITRQISEYRKLANTDTERFKGINAEQTPEEMAREAAAIVIGRYTEKLK